MSFQQYALKKLSNKEELLKFYH